MLFTGVVWNLLGLFAVRHEDFNIGDWIGWNGFGLAWDLRAELRRAYVWWDVGWLLEWDLLALGVLAWGVGAFFVP